MILDFNMLEDSQRYFAMVQAIVPRPIAWVLTLNGGNVSTPVEVSYNLAPFSFFTAICSDPPLLMLSIGKRSSGEEAGSLKDTARNIIEQRNFVVHIASSSYLAQVNASSASLPYGVSELQIAGLDVVDFNDFPIPRIRGCPMAFACTLYQIDEIGNGPQTVVYGKIEQIYVDDDCVEQDVRGPIFNVKNIDPLMRLGGNDYAQLGNVLKAKRPK